MEKIEAPLIFSSKEAYKNLSLVRELEKNMNMFLGQLHSEIIKLSSSGFPLHSSDTILSKFSAAFCGFDDLTLDRKRVRMENALTCWQEFKELVQPLIVSPTVCRDVWFNSDGGPDILPDMPIEISFNKISLPVSVVRGVGPKISRLLEIKEVKTIEDLLYFLPRRYEDRRTIKSIADLDVGGRETVAGEITHTNFKKYGNVRAFELTMSDGHGVLIAKWFRGNLSYLTKTFKKGERILLTGEVTVYRSAKNMLHPDYEILDNHDDENLALFKRIVPVYSETEGLTQKLIRRIMIHAVENYSTYLPSPIPAEICKKRRLIDMHSAINNIHFPLQDHDIGQYNNMRSEAHRRLVFDEFFFFQLGMALKRKKRSLDATTVFRIDDDLPGKFYRLLPYPLTAAQRRVIGEIGEDMASGCTMNRLLQGDVGCGKTVVAFSSMLTSCENGCQAAIMAPTEILAAQHFANITHWAAKLGLAVALLTGTMSAAERKTIYEQIAQGKTDIVIGTHALIQERVAFKNLGLVIIDEQHRFGVRQRSDLRKKGKNPHVLVMTATPIPRTLAMTFYGDLDVSVIDEYPPGRKPVITTVVREAGRQKVYDKIRSESQKGNKTFIVYPLIEESQNLELKNATDMADHLQKDVFPEQRLGLIHGRMPEKDKTRIMADFLGNKLDILISTTIIEVGIEIPQASLMIIEHAERFGLSQLHQLRGRVGRSDIPSHCILMAGREVSGNALKRLCIMEKTNDGFQIAEMDLAIRGPGEFMGTRQSGIPDFRVASIVQDGGTLIDAREDAFSLVENDPGLEKKEHAQLKKVLERRWHGRFDIAKTG